MLGTLVNVATRQHEHTHTHTEKNRHTHRQRPRPSITLSHTHTHNRKIYTPPHGDVRIVRTVRTRSRQSDSACARLARVPLSLVRFDAIYTLASSFTSAPLAGDARATRGLLMASNIKNGRRPNCAIIFGIFFCTFLFLWGWRQLRRLTQFALDRRIPPQPSPSKHPSAQLAMTNIFRDATVCQENCTNRTYNIHITTSATVNFLPYFRSECQPRVSVSQHSDA